MADDIFQPSNELPEAGRGSSRGTPRGPREGREPGGFRIRLSDNEMQAARALQEAFGLRSTVAVLGFSLRTLAQQLESGQLDELVAQQRAQGGARGAAPVRREGERRGGRDQGRGGDGARTPRANPFARPSRPAAPSPEPESGPAPESEAAADGESGIELIAEADAASEVEAVDAAAATDSDAGEA